MKNNPAIDKLKKKIAKLESEIEKRKKIEEELRESEEKYKMIFENASDEIIYVDTEGTLVEANKKIEELFGYTRDEVIGRKFHEFDFVEPEFMQESIKMLDNVVAGKPIRGTVEFQAIRKDGKITVFEGGSGLIKKDGDIKGVLIILRDITERKRTEEALLVYQETLRSLSDQLLQTEEEERRRIARDLHDSIGQALAISKIKLGVLKKEVSARGPAKELEEVRKLIEQAIHDTRTLTFELSPPILYELGFEAAVEWLAEQIQQQHGIHFEFKDDGQPKSMDESLRVLMFRSARELMINVVKHARTGAAEISVQKDNDTIKFIIHDHGSGFDISKIDMREKGKGGFGLFSIRDRLSYIGGRLEVESEHGKGTRVTMVVPLGKS